MKNEQIKTKLLELIKKNKGILEQNVVISETGYSKQEILTALNRLLELYDTRVNLNEKTGSLQFIFRWPLFKRNSRTFGEVIASFINNLIKILKIIYKAAIGVVMICYVVIFAIILIGLSAAGNNDRDSDSGGGFNLVGVLFRAIIEGMYWNTLFRAVEYRTDIYGNRYKVEKDKKGSGFIKGVYNFVFGPDVPKFDPLSDTREVIAYIRLITKGKLTTANIIELSGVNYQIADSKLAEYVGKFNGELDITNEGVLYGDFSEIAQGNVNSVESKNIEFYRNEIEPPVQFTGNKSGRNFAIIAMNTFNIIMSAIIMNAASPELLANITNKDPNIFLQPSPIHYFAFFMLSYFPFVVSSLYFVLPLLRIPSFLKKKNNYRKRVLHKMIVGYICAAKRKYYTFDEIINNLHISDENDKNIIKKMLNKIVYELNGKIELTNDGEMLYIFERLYAELNL